MDYSDTEKVAAVYTAAYEKLAGEKRTQRIMKSVEKKLGKGEDVPEGLSKALVRSSHKTVRSLYKRPAHVARATQVRANIPYSAHSALRRVESAAYRSGSQGNPVHKAAVEGVRAGLKHRGWDAARAVGARAARGLDYPGKK